MTPKELEVATNVAERLRACAEGDVLETARDGTFERNDAEVWAAIMREAADQIDSLRAAMTWQPIETCPCDTPVLLLLPMWFGAVSNIASGELGQNRETTATHWMLRPADPTEAGQ